MKVDQSRAIKKMVLELDGLVRIYQKCTLKEDCIRIELEFKIMTITYNKLLVSLFSDLTEWVFPSTIEKYNAKRDRPFGIISEYALNQ